MTPKDLSFAKDHGKPDPVLEGPRRLLSRPLGLAPMADDLFAAARGSSRKIWSLMAGAMEIRREPRVDPAASRVRPDWPDEVPADIRPALDAFLLSAAEARFRLDRAGASLEPGDADYIAASFFAGTFNAEDRAETRRDMEAAGFSGDLVRRVIAESDTLDPSPAASNFLARVQRVSRPDLFKAGRGFHQAAEALAGSVERSAKWPETLLRVNTELGPVFVGTPGRDEYSGRALLILDPDGDDIYRGAAGVADGRTGQGLAAIVDLKGDDSYKADGLWGAGSALWGAAALLDLEGNDLHEARYAGQGAALCGAAWLEDRGGDDVYRAGGFAQAAAFYGVAVLRERAGRDLYDVGLAGQAYAGVLGFALLADGAGSDRYLAGGREPDHERNDDRHLSLAQGFSIGMRPWAGGGVAALVDLEGNDAYIADIYGQGVSYWYGAGFLLDGGGNDTYQLYQYGQGAGIHLSLGLLADRGGSDQYTGYILCQGAAHDYGVGMLFDQGGDDTYSADHHSQGRALNNALALLVDSGGDDAYFGRQPDQCQGVGNDGGHREYGSLALLLDLAGADRYSCGAADGARMKRPDFGIVYDVQSDP
ncbi:MAG TPA: hypothetical protein P5567_11860 [Kiritimatiellia bacterium]|nr:hypothetical protein [Kiritimatiellia bacterium]HSA17557.1 hypothetical protein [Kiritimatiellia bacterium]